MSTYQPDLSTLQIERIGRKLAADRLEAVDSIQGDVRPATGFYACYGKRCLDVGLSVVALAVTLPINLVIAVITLADLGRPLLFKQVRVGKRAERFTIVKFRNMSEERNDKGDLLPPEQRVTKWGKFVRKTSMDELLNFWSVFKGDMSIIGPRPLPEIYLQRFSKRHMHRLDVRPGLECPPRHLSDSVWTWDEQLENDIWYVEHLSFKTDLIMVVNLVRFAFDRKSATARAVAKRGSFMGYDLDGKAINDADIPAEYIEWVKGLSDEEEL